MAREPIEFERVVGRHVRSRLGADTKVFHYGDDDGTHDVFLISGSNFPCGGVTSYGTFGLSNQPQDFHGKPVFVEILGACASATARFDNLITSCASESMKNGTPAVYGAAMENILDQYELSETLHHVTFVAPFLWEGFEPLDALGRQVHWLLALPISNAELDYLRANGIDALEDRFEAGQIDIYDIGRPSVI